MNASVAAARAVELQNEATRTAELLNEQLAMIDFLYAQCPDEVGEATSVKQQSLLIQLESLVEKPIVRYVGQEQVVR